MLRATTACTFPTSQLPKVVRTPQLLTHFTSKCASRHNGVQFFISHLASWLRTRRFSASTLLSSTLSLLSASSLLCFSSVHIVGSLTSKTSFDQSILTYTFFRASETQTSFISLRWNLSWLRRHLPSRRCMPSKSITKERSTRSALFRTSM